MLWLIFFLLPALVGFAFIVIERRRARLEAGQKDDST
jgi:hypothetical protein